MLRPFQIFVIILAAFFLIRILVKFSKKKVNLFETAIGLVFWLSTTLIAIFPDFISNKLASIFGIKDNINAVLFIILIFMAVVQFRLYNSMREQNQTLTEVIRRLALLEQEKKSNEDSLHS